MIIYGRPVTGVLTEGQKSKWEQSRKEIIYMKKHRKSWFWKDVKTLRKTSSGKDMGHTSSQQGKSSREICKTCSMGKKKKKEKEGTEQWIWVLLV